MRWAILDECSPTNLLDIKAGMKKEMKDNIIAKT